jgi:hypothetical protein
MATSRVKTSSILQGFPKSRSLLAGNSAYAPGAFESIATNTVGSGGVSSVTFSSIPSTYTHLQIRAQIQEDRPTYWIGDCNMTINGATSGYSFHYIFGDGASVSASGSASQSRIDLGSGAIGTTTGNSYAAAIIDILDYNNTNKYKTVRGIMGFDTNGTGGGASLSGRVTLMSGLYQSTTAISSITIAGGNNNLTQYSKFALYGIKGA